MTFKPLITAVFTTDSIEGTPSEVLGAVRSVLAEMRNVAPHLTEASAVLGEVRQGLAKLKTIESPSAKVSALFDEARSAFPEPGVRK